MTAAPILVTKRTLWSWVLSNKLNIQLLLLLTIVVSVLVRLFPLEMQKRIINQAIGKKAVDLLLIYCGLYLAAVIFSSGLKLIIGLLQNAIGQRATAEMRNALYAHILTLPLSTFRKTQPGMIVQSLVNELATAGDFVGMAVAVPVTSILTLTAFAGYLFWLNPWLALVSFSIYPFVLFVLPVLQKRSNRENTKRVDVSRDLSGKIAETISGIHEVQGNGSFQIENSKFRDIVERSRKIRVLWNLYRLLIKISSNLFTGLSPFLIFIFGGYLAINGNLQLGALVAFISAQEKLFDPWRDLIDFWQAYQEASVSYQRTMSYFDIQPEFEIKPKERSPLRFSGTVDIRDLSLVVDEGIVLLDDVTLSIAAGEQVALVGSSGSGKSMLTQCISQLSRYTGGHVLIDGQEVLHLSKQDIAANVGLVSQFPFIFGGTIDENLLYACRAVDQDGTAPLPDLNTKIEILQQTGLFADILRFGLNSLLPPEKYDTLAPQLIAIRKRLARRLPDRLREYVEFYEKEKYLKYSTVAKNLTFGSANDERYAEKNLVQNPEFKNFLQLSGLTPALLQIGARLCTSTLEILKNMPPDNSFFDQSPIAADEISEYRLIADLLGPNVISSISQAQQQLLLKLSLRFIPGQHKMAELSPELQAGILKARTQFRRKISAESPGAFSFYRRSDYIRSQSILHNLFFGHLKTGNPKVQDSLNALIIQLLVEKELLESILEIGLQFPIGSKGEGLSGGQRQKLAVARAMLKRPAILILDEATSALDNKSQTRIQTLLDTHLRGKTTVIAVVHRLDIVRDYDKIGLMRAGKLEEIGTYEALMARKGLFSELVGGKT